MNRIRIIYLIGQLGLGGSERQLYLILKHMDKSKFDPHVVVFNPSANYTLDDALRRAGVQVHAVPPAVKDIARRIAWLFRLFRHLSPQIVHSWSLHDNPYAGLVGWLAGVPHRLGSVRGALASPDFTNFHPVLRWLILHSVQGLLVNAETITTELHQAGVPAHRVQVLPNGVEVNDSPPPKTLPGGFPQGARVVGIVANLRAEKNIPMFIRGLAQVLPDFQDVYGLLIGQPVLTSDPGIPALVEQEIQAQGMRNHIKIGGFHADVPSILPGFEIFCLTSDSEGMPNAILEAMAAGLPVVATRVGGIPRLVSHGETGLLVNRGDVVGFASAVRSLLQKPDLARQMGLAGRRRVEQEFSCQALAPQVEAYYFSCIKVKIN